MEQNNKTTMKQVIFRTKNGSHLYLSEGKFSSENPDDVIMALAIDASYPSVVQAAAYHMLRLIKVAGITKL